MTRTISTRNLTDLDEQSDAPRSWARLDRAIRGGAAADYTQGALALTYPLPSGLEALPQARALSVVPPPQETPRADAAETWAAHLLQAVLEVVSGDRPLSQLVRWTDGRVYRQIAHRQQLRSSLRTATRLRGGRQHVATVHVCQLSATTAEVAARVITGPRSSAMAARLELHRSRWMCTAIQFG